MTLPAGSRLGPYEILAPLGAGGMGEVYRAKDPRLGREVAVKVLPASFSKDADRLRRFELEARAAGLLNHPNVTAVYDIGTHDGAPYVVTELLEGETLRGRISGGAVAVRKATDWALQIAHGLAAAHGKGIVHRDLKPENIFVTKDGRIKILDFGLAKLTRAEEPAPGTDLPTAAAATEPGVVLGTLGYMSPEQVKGMNADARSDIFAFGAIFYEMLSGTRAFHRPSAAETMSAILREEPPDLSASNQSVPAGLDRIVRHCLEKSPDERFHSAHDLAFDLETLSGVSAPRAAMAAAAGKAPAAGRGRRLALSLAAAAALLAAGAGLYLAGKKAGRVPPPSYKQITFRRGTILSARFAPDGKAVLYSASWDGLPGEIYQSSPGSPDSRPLGMAGADLLAVSSSGEAAVSLRTVATAGFIRIGTLARVSVTGAGAPREVLEGAEAADWSPDGKELAVVRRVAARERLEFPIGKVLNETSGWIGDPRVSPRGDRVAFIDHPTPGDDGGSIAIVDRAGKKSVVSPHFASARGLAWSPDGSEVWVTAAESGSNRLLYAVGPSALPRMLARVTGSLRLHDVSRDGRVLVTRDTERQGFFANAPGEPKDRDLSWLDYGQVVDISADGKTVLFFESGEGGGAGYAVYVRKTDGSPAVRLGEGSAAGLSPDGRWVLATVHGKAGARVALYPTGAGEARVLTPDGMKARQSKWFPDGRRFLMIGQEEGHGPRVYVQDVDGGKPRAVTPERYGGLLSISPDGKRFVARGPDERFFVFSADGGEPAPVPGVAPRDVVVGWTTDSNVLFVRRPAPVPANIERLDIRTGRAEPWKDLAPADTTGLTNVGVRAITPDGRFYAYNCAWLFSDLFLVEGVR